VNLSILLARLLPWMAGLTVGAAIATLVMRTFALPLWPVGAAFALAFVLLLVLLVRREKERFWGAEDGLARLEIANQLGGRLTTAQAGIGQWPEAIGAGDAFRSRLLVAGGPLLAGLVIWALAAWLPLPQSEAGSTPLTQPLAFTETEELLQALEQVEQLEPESIDRFEEALDQLRSRPAEEWYSHSSLEAGESLLANLQDSARRLADSLEGADGALGQVGSDPTSASDATAERASRNLRQALDGMDASELRIGEGLKQALQNAGTPEGLRQLSLAQLQRIQIQIQQIGTGVCKGLGSEFGSEAGQDGEGPGKGGINRGPGTAPLTIGPREAVEESGVEGGVASDLDGDVGIGDVVGTRLTRPEENEQPFSISRGGEAAISAASEAVNRQPVTPAERRILQRYFQ